MAKLDFEQRQEAQGIIDLATDEDALADAIYKLIGERDTAFARGRAEGAEQERERIRKAADHYEAEDELPYAELVDGNYVGASCEIYVIPASLLAPDKESEK